VSNGATPICRVAAALAVLLAAAGAPPLLDAQQRGDASPATASQQSRALDRLGEAARLEAAGDLPGAEAVVREVLASHPTSLTALLALERLLAVQARPIEVLGAVDRLLAVDPGSATGHLMRLRAVAQAGDGAAVEAAVRQWIRATPQLETPYREAALVHRQRGEHRRAIAVLEEGRRRIDRDDALALELGDAHADAGDMALTAAEWARAVGPDGRGFLLVQRRVHGLPDGGASVVPHLVQQLGAAGAARAGPGRQKAAALIAIGAGLESAARRLSEQLAATGRPAEREALLVEIARRADGAALHGLAIWAYTELLRVSPEPGAGLAVRTRLAELALATGDTALASTLAVQLESAAAAGSPQRRQALAMRARLTAAEGDLLGATDALRLLRSEYPQAPELDETAALLAARLVAAGLDEEARALLTGVQGARSAQVRARLYLRAGDLGRAREQIMAAAPLLRGREATETLALAALLMRLSPAGGEVVARVLLAGHALPAMAPPEELLPEAAAAARRLPAADRAAVLEFLAGMADRAALPDDAAALRGEIVATLPQSHEAPAALLVLARRSLERDQGGAEEAIMLLERLILEYPRSTLTPQARHELQRLRAGSAS
jgi:hypothetical protein